MVVKKRYGEKPCVYSVKILATKECAKGFGCKLDGDKVVYPTSCFYGKQNDCWRVKSSK